MGKKKGGKCGQKKKRQKSILIDVYRETREDKELAKR